jgi:hypothetical protein
VKITVKAGLFAKWYMYVNTRHKYYRDLRILAQDTKYFKYMSFNVYTAEGQHRERDFYMPNAC